MSARLSALERNFELIDGELAVTQAAVDQERRDRMEADTIEGSARESSIQSLDRRLEETSTGSFTFSLFGVVWLAVGLALSSTSVEVARWMARLAKWTAWTW